MNSGLTVPNRSQLISKSADDIPYSVNSSVGVMHQGYFTYTGPEISNRSWGILDDSKVLSIYTEKNEDLIRQMDLRDCEVISQETDKEEFRLTVALDNVIYVITTDSTDKWVKVLKEILGFEIRVDAETEDVFMEHGKSSNYENDSLESLQKELQDEIRRLESKKGGIGKRMAAITNKYDRAQLAAKQEALRNHTALKMRKISTQLKIDSMQDYLKKQFRRSSTLPQAFLEKQVEELTEELDGINNDIDATEHDEAMTVENINEMLTKEMDALKALYGPPLYDPPMSPKSARNIADKPRSNSIGTEALGKQLERAREFEQISKDKSKVERRKDKFFKRLSTILDKTPFRNTIHGYPDNSKNSFEADINDVSVPSFQIIDDIPDGGVAENEETPSKKIYKALSQDSLDARKEKIFKIGRPLSPSPQSSFEDGSTESLDLEKYYIKEIRPETLEIIDEFEKMIHFHLKTHKENIWD